MELRAPNKAMENRDPEPNDFDNISTLPPSLQMAIARIARREIRLTRELDLPGARPAGGEDAQLPDALGGRKADLAMLTEALAKGKAKLTVEEASEIVVLDEQLANFLGRSYVRTATRSTRKEATKRTYSLD